MSSPVKLDPLLGDLVSAAVFKAAAPGLGTVAAGLVAPVVLDHLCHKGYVRYINTILFVSKAFEVLAHLLKV